MKTIKLIQLSLHKVDLRQHSFKFKLEILPQVIRMQQNHLRFCSTQSTELEAFRIRDMMYVWNVPGASMSSVFQHVRSSC